MKAADPRRRAMVFDALVRASRDGDAGTPQRWQQLEAAHIVGQKDLALHLRAHAAMLVLAWQTRDAREVAGQLARLALVAPGHLLGRLPVGNTGRARVSAFTPMAVDAGTARCIRAASEAIGG
ncbi:MAG: DUF3703 domain-containing protein [Ramlibacter sp.]